MLCEEQHWDEGSAPPADSSEGAHVRRDARDTRLNKEGLHEMPPAGRAPPVGPLTETMSSQRAVRSHLDNPFTARWLPTTR
jgi:hypothetical protein